MAAKNKDASDSRNSRNSSEKAKPKPAVSVVSVTSSVIARKKRARRRKNKKSSEENGSGDAPKWLPPPEGGEYTQTIPPFLGYVRHTLTKQRLPAYTLAARTTPPGFVSDKHASPGPARYGITKNLNCRGKPYDGGITMALGRERDGPNRSRLITQAIQEQQALQEAEQAAVAAAAVPAATGGTENAPSTLTTTHLASTTNTAAAKKAAVRHKLAKTTAQIVAAAYQQHAIPGPGRYRPEQYPNPRFPRAPVWSTAGRLHSLDPHRNFPSPAEYKLPLVFGPRVPNKPAAPAAGLGERTKYGGVEINDRANDAATGPGPARYGMPNPDRVMWSNGDGASMKSRPRNANSEEGKKTYWFGTMNVSKTRSPQFSFGIKHSLRKRNF